MVIILCLKSKSEILECARGRVRFFGSKKKNQKSAEEDVQSREQEEKRIYSIKFAKWARDNQYKPYLDYIWSFEEITLGVFYACEFLLLLLIFVSIPVWPYTWKIFQTSWFEMLMFTLIVSFFSYWLYRVTKRKHYIDLEPFNKMFKSEEMWKQFD